MTHTKRKGAALIVVLLLAATLSFVALSIADAMRRSAERGAAFRARSEALWFAFGAEQLALALVKEGVAASPKKLTSAAPWIGKPTTFPLEQGFATVIISDATRCFNLNALVVSRAQNRLDPSESGAAAFAALIAAVAPDDFVGETALAAAATDWIDSDSFNEPQGAEDGTYLSEKVPRRTGGVLFADPSELRAVSGMPGAAFAQLRRLICAYARAEPHPVNVNMLREEDAPLLAGLTEGALTASDAAAVIADRPAAGYDTIEEFWSHPGFKQKQIPRGARASTALTSRYLEARAVINHGGQSLDLTLTIEVSQSALARIVARRYGPLE